MTAGSSWLHTRCFVETTTIRYAALLMSSSIDANCTRTLKDGLPGCGRVVSCGLARYRGVGKCIIDLFSKRHYGFTGAAAVKDTLEAWRDKVGRYLAHDPLGFIGRRKPSLQQKITGMKDFPRLGAVNDLLLPMVSPDAALLKKFAICNRKSRAGIPQWKFGRTDVDRLWDLCGHYFSWNHAALEATFDKPCHSVWQALALRVMFDENSKWEMAGRPEVRLHRGICTRDWNADVLSIVAGRRAMCTISLKGTLLQRTVTRR